MSEQKTLETVTVGDILGDTKEGAVVVIEEAGSSLKKVLQLLNKHNIHSMPVVDNEKQCIGWIDHTDVLRHLIEVSHKTKESSTTPPSNHLKDDDMDMLVERSNDFKLATAMETLRNKRSSVDKASASQPILPVTKGAPIKAIFQNYAVGVTRLPVVEPDNHKLINYVLTQSAVNAYLAENLDLIGDEANKTIKQLGLVRGKIVSVNEDTPTIDAFETMAKKGLNNVSVVNERGALKGCLSATDLKLLSDFKFRSLLLPVKKFVEHVRNSEQLSKSYLVFCEETATLGDVIKKLSEFRVHRVFVVDKAMKPIGVVSLNDVSAVLAKKYEWEYRVFED